MDNKRYDVYVVGMRKEYFVDEGPGEDCCSDDVDITNERDILFCKTENGRTKFTITLETQYGWCGSGYCTASWGMLSISYVSEFGPATHLPKDRTLKIEGLLYSPGSWQKPEHRWIWLDDDNFDIEHCDIDNNVFHYEYDGDDSYYPCGGTYVNMDLFDALPRAFTQRPVWILYGESASGKSTFGYAFSLDKVVYETDSANKGILPTEIWADIIVVGNKWKAITVDEVIKRLPEGTEAIRVAFNKESTIQKTRNRDFEDYTRNRKENQ